MAADLQIILRIENDLFIVPAAVSFSPQRWLLANEDKSFGTGSDRVKKFPGDEMQSEQRQLSNCQHLSNLRDGLPERVCKNLIGLHQA
jgi:hypothetical protein